jgi:hypothetical protein
MHAVSGGGGPMSAPVIRSMTRLSKAARFDLPLHQAA